MNQSHNSFEYYNCANKYIDYQKQIEAKEREVSYEKQAIQDFESKKKQIFEQINN